MTEACGQEFAIVGDGTVQDNLWSTTGAACGLIDATDQGAPLMPKQGAEPGVVVRPVDAGYQRPLAGDLRTREQRQAFRAAADGCGIDLPPGFFRHAARIGARHWWRGLTAEERQCMKDQGVQRPIGWPTDDEIQAFRDAAATCGVDLPGGVDDDGAAA